MPGTVVVETIDSRALANNTLGDPAVRRVAVWLPPSYSRSVSRHYPVIYWLAGYAGTGESLFHGTPWQPGLGQRLDRLVDTGAMGEVIVVAPDGFTRWGGSQYLDSPVSGGHETHVVKEVVATIDGRYRTYATREARAIGGKSSGGFGALVLGMRHADVFSAVASHAGDMYFELSIIPDVPVAVRTLRKHGGVHGFLQHFDHAIAKRPDDFTTIMMLALSAAYSPDPDKPHGIALPFDLGTGELDHAVWRRWKAWDPIDLIAGHVDQLRSMKLVYLDAGTRDEHALDLGARVLAARLATLGVSFRHEEFDDGHRGTSYRYDVSLPLLAGVLDAEPAAPMRGPSAR
jgi:enterochelin esterase family protein